MLRWIYKFFFNITLSGRRGRAQPRRLENSLRKRSREVGLLPKLRNPKIRRWRRSGWQPKREERRCQRRNWKIRRRRRMKKRKLLQRRRSKCQPWRLCFYNISKGMIILYLMMCFYLCRIDFLRLFFKLMGVNKIWDFFMLIDGEKVR